MALFRVDFSGRGELAERQQKLAQMLSRLQKISEGLNRECAFMQKPQKSAIYLTWHIHMVVSQYTRVMFLIMMIILELIPCIYLAFIYIYLRVQRSSVCHQPNDSWSRCRNDVRWQNFFIVNNLEEFLCLKFLRDVFFFCPLFLLGFKLIPRSQLVGTSWPTPPPHGSV